MNHLFGSVPLFVELHPVFVFSHFAFLLHVSLCIDLSGLVGIHLLDEFLLALQLLDAFVRSIIFHAQPYNPVLDALLLVLLLLCNHDSIHHHVVRFMRAAYHCA